MSCPLLCVTSPASMWVSPDSTRPALEPTSRLHNVYTRPLFSASFCNLLILWPVLRIELLTY
jgi:hypothetical protein